MKHERTDYQCGRLPSQLSSDHDHDQDRACAKEPGRVAPDEPVNRHSYDRQPVAYYQQSSVSQWTQSPQRSDADHGISSHLFAPSASSPSFWVPPQQQHHPKHPGSWWSSGNNGFAELSYSARITSGDTSTDCGTHGAATRGYDAEVPRSYFSR